MRFQSCLEAPFSLCGLLGRIEEGAFWRLPDDIIDTISPNISLIARRSSGGRVRFRTNASEISFRMRLKNLEPAQCMPLSGSAGADIFTGVGENSRFCGFIAPENYEDRTAKTTIHTKGTLEQYTINLPRNEQLESFEIGIEEGALLLPALPYRYETPVVFYGSSITEGGAASRPGMAYASRVCRWLDTDYINLGFARSACGEPGMADFISSLAMSAFVFDYDYNAPSVEALKQTHEPFFRKVRQNNPELPILIMSRPNFYTDEAESRRRRAVIEETYYNAIAAGDRNVYFIDGETFFPKREPTNCTVDGIHPNDEGFLHMANEVYPILRCILARVETENSILRRLREYSTPELCDGASHRIHMDSAIKPMAAERKIVGRAFTVEVPFGAGKAIAQAIEQTDTGDVIVIAAGANCNTSSWGDHRSACALRKGIEGVVIDGAFRDVDGCNAVGVPIFARALTNAAALKTEGGIFRKSISCAGIVVNNGDIIVGDENGVCVFPYAEAEEIMQRADKKIKAQKDAQDEMERTGQVIVHVEMKRS